MLPYMEQDKLISFVKHAMFCQIFCHCIGFCMWCSFFLVFCVVFCFSSFCVLCPMGTVYEGFDNREIMYLCIFRGLNFSLFPWLVIGIDPAEWCPYHSMLDTCIFRMSYINWIVAWITNIIFDGTVRIVAINTINPRTSYC